MLHYFFQELWCHYSFTKRQYWNWNISYARCYQKFRPSCRNHRPSAHEHSLCYLYAYVGRLCQYSMSKNQNQIFGLCPSGRSSIFHLRNTICKIFKYCKVSCCQGECRHGIFSCFFLTDLFWDSEQGNRSHIMQDLFIAPTLFTVVYHNEIKIPESNFFWPRSRIGHPSSLESSMKQFLGRFESNQNKSKQMKINDVFYRFTSKA